MMVKYSVGKIFDFKMGVDESNKNVEIGFCVNGFENLVKIKSVPMIIKEYRLKNILEVIGKECIYEVGDGATFIGFVDTERYLPESPVIHIKKMLCKNEPDINKTWIGNAKPNDHVRGRPKPDVARYIGEFLIDTRLEINNNEPTMKVQKFPFGMRE